MAHPIEDNLRKAFTDIMESFVANASNSATDPELFIPQAVDEMIAKVYTYTPAKV